jgi:beta-phosphoglucomutase-like phosphatase (HAD superfamily)
MTVRAVIFDFNAGDYRDLAGLSGPEIVDRMLALHGKPDSEGCLRATAALNAAVDTRPDVTAAEVLVCEDADPGIQTAKAANMCCLAVQNPAHTGHPVAADVVLERLDPADVERLLGM